MRRLFQSKVFKLLLLFAALCCGLYFGFRRRTVHVYVEKRMSAAIGCPVTIRSITCTPLLSLHLHDFTIGGNADAKSGESPLFVAETAKVPLLPFGSALCAEGAKICFTEEAGLFPGVIDAKHPDRLAAPVLGYFKEVSSRLGTLRFFLKDAVVTIPTERGTLTLQGVTWERRVLPLQSHNPKMVNVALDESRFQGETTWAPPVLIVNNLSVAGAATLSEGSSVSIHPVFLLYNIWQNPVDDSWLEQKEAPSVLAPEEPNASVLEPEALAVHSSGEVVPAEATPPSGEVASAEGHDVVAPAEEKGAAEATPAPPLEQAAPVEAEAPVALPQEGSDKAEASVTIEAK